VKAVIYTRVSSPGQATADAASLEAQEQIARGICAAQGWEVFELYQDAGKSATKDSLDNRPAMQALLRDAAAGKFSHLAVYHLDRLARQTEVAAEIALGLRRARVTIHTQQGPADLEAFGGRLLYYLNGLMAEEEAHRIRERCDNGRRFYAKRGDFAYWQAPFGYRWIAGDLRKGKPNRLLPVAEELATVRLVYDLATKKGLSVRKIAEALNERHIHTRGGAQWYSSNMVDVLRDSRYMGVWRVWAEGGQEWFAREDLIPEAAVTEAQWKQAQKARAHHKARTRRPMLNAHLLNGHLVCAECGSPMIGHQLSDAPVLRYYTCSRKQANADKPCRGRYVAAEPLEAEALGLLTELAEHPHMARSYADSTREKALPVLIEEQGRHERAIAACDRQVEALLGRLVSEDREQVISDDDFRLKRGLIAADKAAWQERLSEIAPLIMNAELSVRAAEAVADTLAGVNVQDLDLQQRRWLLAQLDFTMTLACQDWRAKSQERRYEVTSRWAGTGLLGESAVTRDYAVSPNALATYTAI
jgi:DNA invertase Pin-like site-specific DNA recombinase